jgi:hypothetical protein
MSYEAERKVEVQCERFMDRLDRKYLRAAISEEEYEAEIRRIEEWAREQHRRFRK